MKFQILLAVAAVCMAQMNEDDEKFLNTITLQDIEQYFIENSSKALECYKLIKDQYEKAVTRFIENMEQFSSDIKLHYGDNEQTMEEAKYGVLKLAMIGQFVIGFQETIWEYLSEGDLEEAFSLFDRILETVKGLYVEFVPQRKYLLEKSLNDQYSTFDDFLDMSLNQTESYMKIIEKYFETCMGGKKSENAVE